MVKYKIDQTVDRHYSNYAIKLIAVIINNNVLNLWSC